MKKKGGMEEWERQRKSRWRKIRERKEEQKEEQITTKTNKNVITLRRK